MQARQRLRVVGAIAGIIVLLAGCGDDGGSDGGDTGTGGDEEVHALGEEVAVGHVEFGLAGERGAETTIGITPLEVRTGTQQELKQGGFEIDAEDQDTTPYYVDVRYENEGEVAVKRNLNVDFEDADGNLITNTVIFNFGGKVFKPCPAITDGQLQPGDSYESCTLILVPNDLEPERISFLSDKGEGEPGEFVYWEIEE